MPPSIARNITANWISLVATGLVGLVTTPVIIRYLGEEPYGVLAIIVAIVGQAVIFDFGVRNAVVRYVSQYTTSGDTEALSRITSAAFIILLLSSITVCALGIGFAPALPEWTKMPLSLHQVAAIALIVATLDAALELISGVVEAALAGRERYELLSYGTTVRSIVYLITLVPVVMYGGGIIGVLVCGFATRACYRLWLYVRLRREAPEIRFVPRELTRSDFGQVLGYGAWACAIVVATRVIYSLDVLIVGYLFGPLEAGMYAVCILVVDHIRQLAQSATTVLTPRFSALGTASGEADTRELIVKSVRYLQALGVIAVIPAAMTGKAFLGFFAGPSYMQAAMVLAILVLPFLVCLPGYLFTSYMYATSKHRVTAILLMIEAISNISLSIWLGSIYGMVGVALGTLIPSIIFRGIALPAAGLHLAKISRVTYAKELFVRPVILAAATALGILLGEATWGLESITGWVGTNMCGVIAFASVAPAVLFSAKEQRRILNSLKSLAGI